MQHDYNATYTAGGTDFGKIFGVRKSPGAELRAALLKYRGSDRLHRFSKERRSDADDDGDDRRVTDLSDDGAGFDVNALSDDQIDALRDRLGIDDDDDDNGGDGNGRHHVDQLADLVAEGSNIPRAAALHWLLHNRAGAALVQRLRKALTHKRKDQPMDRMQVLESFVKNDGGMLVICKHVVNGGEVQLSEQHFTELCTTAAKRDYPNDRPDAAFAKYFEAHQIVREAHRVVKGLIMPMTQQASGGAYAELMAKADALRKQDSSLTEAQAFAKAFSDPNNRELAAAERAQNRPRAG